MGTTQCYHLSVSKPRAQLEINIQQADGVEVQVFISIT